MKKLFFFSVTLFSILTLTLTTSCSSDENGGGNEEGRKWISLEINEQQAANATNEFGFDLFSHIVSSSDADENVIVSPVSASIALSMLSNGCNEKLAAQIAEVLGCDDTAALNSLSAKYFAELPQVDPSATVNFANSVWYSERFTLTQSFLDAVQSYYTPDIFVCDFADNTDGVQQDINKWVSDKTKGVIKSFELPLDSLTTSVFANTLYFKGFWSRKFNKADTKTEEFFGTNSTVYVPMMHKTLRAKYAVDERYAMARLDFGKGAYRVTFVLPNEGVSTEELLESGEFKFEYLDMVYTSNITFSMPRFKIDNQAIRNMTGDLVKMGLTTLDEYLPLVMFNEYITSKYKVYQKCAVEFNEDGGEAVAATFVQGMTTSPGPSPSAVMNLNRPFLFYITEGSTGAILFAGRVAQL
ncbi:MAG: hypothetical protein K2L28_08035 [Muribaculaceae bacterium]|nr:hypothetical protein [Muribaculaceae bacterium]